MKFYQRILIDVHSRVDKLGWLNGGTGLVIYSKLYFAYKKHLEGRELIRQLKYLKRSNSSFSVTSLVIDIGAHIGFFTRETLRLFPGITVIAIEQGTGRNSKRLGALVCEGEDDGKYITVNVGSGFSDEDRDSYWNNQSAIIGRTAEILCDAVTQNQDGSYSLRFPRFVRFRDDK